MNGTCWLVRWLVLSVLIWFGCSQPGWAATRTVNIGNNFYSPSSVTIDVNDTVQWVWIGSTHSTTSTTGLWDSGTHGTGFSFSRQFNTAGNFPYSCTVHPFQTGSITVQAVNTPPTVSISSPSDGSVFDAPANFTLEASASDPGGSIAQVEFFRNGTSLGIDTSSPFSVAVNSLAAGSYTFSAVATDNLGATGNATLVSITVQPPNTPPTVAITSPTDGTVFDAPANFTLEASASDPDGSIAQVEFFRDTTSLGIDASSPYSVPVSDLAAGNHAFSAVATDNLGANTTSSLISVSVANTAPVMLSNAQRVSDSQFTFTYTVTPGLRYVVERSADLSIWIGVETNTPTSSPASFTDNAASNKMNYYRVGRLPNN